MLSVDVVGVAAVLALLLIVQRDVVGAPVSLVTLER
jgi:hypothetical protein